MTKENNKISIGEKISDFIADIVKTWKFVIFQISFIFLWISLNIFLPYKWDPFPFQLLKLIVTIQGFFTASMLLMSQAKQAKKDRIIIYKDYIIDVCIKNDISKIKILEEDNKKRLERLEKKLNE